MLEISLATRRFFTFFNLLIITEIINCIFHLGDIVYVIFCYFELKLLHIIVLSYFTHVHELSPRWINRTVPLTGTRSPAETWTQFTIYISESQSASLTRCVFLSNICIYIYICIYVYIWSVTGSGPKVGPHPIFRSPRQSVTCCRGAHLSRQSGRRPYFKKRLW